MKKINRLQHKVYIFQFQFLSNYCVPIEITKTESIINQENRKFSTIQASSADHLQLTSQIPQLKS